MWNQRNLCPPPANSFKVTLTQQWKGKLLRAQQGLKNGKEILSVHEKVLKSEQYIQDQFIYKMSSQFRSEKSLKNMKQTKVCLKRLEEMHLERQLTELSNALDCDFEYPEEEVDVYLPSRQMLQYDLVRLMSLAALLSRICQLSYNIYFHAKQLMEIGNLIPQNTVMVAIAARIWVTCKSLRSYVCVWYEVLFPLLHHLQATPVPWVKSDSELPVCLYDWLRSQFCEDSWQEDDRFRKRAMHIDLDDNLVEEERTDGRKDALHIEMTDDIGEPVQRKRRRDDLYQSNQTKEVIDNTAECLEIEMSEKDLDDNSIDESIMKPDQAVTEVSKQEKKLRKYLKKQLTSVDDIIIYLKQIKSKDALKMNNGIQLVVSKSLKKKRKQWLLACKKYLKQGGTSNFAIKMRKTLIRELMKLDTQNKVKIGKQKMSAGALQPDIIIEVSDQENTETLKELSEISDNKVTKQKKMKAKKKLKKAKVKGNITVTDRKKYENADLPDSKIKGKSSCGKADTLKGLPETSDNKVMKQRKLNAKNKLKKTKVKGNITVTDRKDYENAKIPESKIESKSSGGKADKKLFRQAKTEKKKKERKEQILQLKR